MEELKRWVILLLSAFTGAAAAIGYGILAFPASKEVSKALSKANAEGVERGTVMEVCVIFFGITYLCGGLLARLFRSPRLADEIRRRGSWHMSILGAFLGLLTAQRIWFTHQGDWRRFDNIFCILCLLVMTALVIVFKLKIGIPKPASDLPPPSRSS